MVDRERRCPACQRPIERRQGELARNFLDRKSCNQACAAKVRPKRGSVETRFWAKVSKTDGCWNWTAAKTSDGYGELSVDNRPVYAHKISWEIHRGPVPDDGYVCHRCDNPSCVRPDHLFLGDHPANMKDMSNKGRGPMGGAKLDWDRVDDMREKRHNGYLLRELAAQNSVAISTVSEATNKKTWRIRRSDCDE